MEHRLLEVCILSADDLKDIRYFSKMETYAEVSMPPYVEYTTQVDRKGGTNPVWNEKFTFMVPNELLRQRDAKMTVQIFSMGMLGDAKLVGSVSIPLSDISGLTPEKIAHSIGDVQYRSYPVKTATEHYQGELHVSFLLGEKLPLKPSLKPGDGELAPQAKQHPAYPVWSYESAGAHQPEPTAPSSLQQAPPAPPREPPHLPTKAPPPRPYEPPSTPPPYTRRPAPPGPTSDSSSRRPPKFELYSSDSTISRDRRPAPGAESGVFAGALGKILLNELISDSPYDRGSRA